MMTRTPHRHRLAVLLIAVAAAAPWVAAEEVQMTAAPPELVIEFQPPRVQAETLSLTEAVQLAVANDPQVHLARQDTRLREGLAQAATGTFDRSFTLDLTFQHAQGLLVGGLLRNETGKRNLFRILSREFDNVAADLERQLQEGIENPRVNCPEGVDIVIGRQSICISDRTQNNRDLVSDLLDTVIGVEDNPTQLVNLRDILEERRRIEYGNLIDILHLNAYLLRRQLRDMGTIPDIDEQTTITLDLRYAMPFRTGVVFGPGVIIDYTRDNFDGKPKNPQYGGKGKFDTYSSILGLVVDLPLGKGRGRATVEAPERAAGLNLEASVSSQSHTLSASVLRTLTAYWSLVGSQQRLAIQEQSLATQRKLLEYADALVDADELAEADVTQLRARIADGVSAVLDSRLAVLNARVGLAETLGLAVERVDDAPLAETPFPQVPGPAALDAWTEAELERLAVAQRDDLAAARTLTESARVLAEAARVDLRRTIDLQLTAGYTAVHEGGSFRKGLEGIFTEDFTGPSAMISLKFELPFANNTALGRYAQARATVHRSHISAVDLERRIGTNVDDLIGAIRDVAGQVAQLEESARQHRETIASETEKFRLGEGTVIDVIFTEEQLTSTELSLVTARETFTTLLAQLRYELGALVLTHRSDGRVVVDEIHPAGLEMERTSAL